MSLSKFNDYNINNNNSGKHNLYIRKADEWKYNNLSEYL